MRHIFIVNPVSGKRDAGEALLPAIKKAAGECGVEAEIVYTEAPKHATALAEGYGETGQAVRLYAVGGDGTLNEVFAGAYRHPNAEVACVPCGSGNDFIRTFGEAGDFLDIKAQLRGTAHPVDLMEVDGGICAAITSAGLDAEVAFNIPRYRRIPLLGGSAAYNISILGRLLRPLGKQMAITIDGRPIEGKYLIVAVCNAQHYGGGYRAAPMARPDDGVLDVILVKKISRLLIASIIGRYKKGLHCEGAAIVPDLRNTMQYYSAKEVEIHLVSGGALVVNADGECAPAPRLYAKVLPRAALFCLPARLHQKQAETPK